MTKFLHSPSTTLVSSTLALLFLVSCEKTEIEALKPARGLRQQVSEPNDLPPINVVTIDNTAKRILDKEKAKKSKGYTTYDQVPTPCEGYGYFYVGGLNMQSALDVTAEFLSGNNFCGVVWTGVGDGGVGITVARDKQSSGETWNVTWSGPGAQSTWILGGGNTYDGNQIAPQLPPEGAGYEGMTLLENQVYSSMNTDQQTRYINNYYAALSRHDFLRGLCGGGGSGDNSANAFLHAYWTALNARSLGPDLALRLVSAHEAFSGNILSHSHMDHYNDMIGLARQRYNPSADETTLSNLVENSIVTGHGRRVDGDLTLRTSNNLCD